eukprot:jgi/Mesvir1/17173/Mv07595-RA.1
MEGGEFFSASQSEKTYSWTSGAKNVMDPVHGYVELPAEAWRFIDTQQCQRLGDIKQLGTTHLVYPGACHSRKEHSLGVLHLSNELIQHIYSHQKEELGLEPIDVIAVRLGGLCHDWGHGPFSHVFDNEFLPAVRPGCPWTHEQMSADMLDYAIDANYIDLDDCKLSNPGDVDMSAAIKLAKEIIVAAKDGYDVTRSHREKAWLMGIVANPKSGMDVDKWDYVQRDGYHCGIKIAFDHRLLLQNSKVQDNELCFRVNAMSTCYSLFQTRARLFTDVYTHRTGKACEFMVRDALIAADPVLKLSAAIDDPGKFTALNDSVINRIEFPDEDKAEGLAAAREIVRRLRRRDLYQFVNQYIVPGLTDSEVSNYPKVTAEHISQHLPYDGMGTRLSAADIIVENLVLHHGMKAQNPVEAIRFFDPHREDTFQCRVLSQE